MNMHEISNATQTRILRLAGLLRGIRRITVESMAKYITEHGARLFRRAVPREVELEIGMGFEAQSSVVRNVCINKGESLRDFHRAVAILREAGLRSVAYVILKPPFLSEGESNAEAIATVAKAREIGFDAVSLEPMSIHRYSLVDALFAMGTYQVPWLWSVLEVARQSRYIEDLRIGGSGFFPRPVEVAHNRHATNVGGCNGAIWERIREYGRTRDVSLFEHVTCACKRKWREACEETPPSLKDRIDEQLAGVDLAKYERIRSQTSKAIRSYSAHYTTALAGKSQT